MKFRFTDSTYNFLKWFVQLALPAFAALYFGLASIWGLPAAEQVVGTIALFTTFLGVLLGISTKQYYESDAPYDGQILVQETVEGEKTFTLALDSDPYDIPNRKSVSFKVAEE